MFASVLIVDPDPIISQSLEDQFGSSGCSCRQAASVEEAAALIVESGKHLLGLVTAIDLPGGQSGWDIARLARKI